MQRWMKVFRDDETDDTQQSPQIVRKPSRLDDKLIYLCYFRDGGDNARPAVEIPPEYGAYIATGERQDPAKAPAVNINEINLRLADKGEIKFCNFCNQYHDIGDFYTGNHFKSRHNPNGIFNICKKCYNKRDYLRKKQLRTASKYKRYKKP